MSRKTSIALAIAVALAAAGISPSVSAKSMEENSLQKQEATPQEQVEDSTQPKQCTPCGVPPLFCC